MTRFALSVRMAVPSDAPALAALWCDVLRRGDEADRISDCLEVISRAEGCAGDRLVVVTHDGEIAGAAYLRSTTVSAINLEPVLQVTSPQVFERFRKHGVGTTLLAAAGEFADERGIAHVCAAALATSRDANRFMARSGLAPLAMLRVAPTSQFRAKVALMRPAPVRDASGSGRQIDRILVARRLRRRAESVN